MTIPQQLFPATMQEQGCSDFEPVSASSLLALNMERGNPWDLVVLLKLLVHVDGQAEQLEAILEAAAGSTAEHCRCMLQQIRYSLDEAVSLAKVLIDPGEPQLPAAPPDNMAASESPPSKCGSLGSENLERALKGHERREMCNKRKTLPKWTNQVRLSGGGRVGDGLEDGFSWRKYGQKKILGARHPRCYYRCTHRSSAGCLATKQVQRSDNDPWVFDVSYRGEHTCLHKLQSPPTSMTNESAMQQLNCDVDPPMIHQSNLVQATADDFALEPDRGLSGCSFSFISATAPSFGLESHEFSSAAAKEGNYAGAFSDPPLRSPTTSEPNYYSVLSPRTNGSGRGIVLPGSSACGPVTDHIFCAATSTSNSTLANASFTLDRLEFNPIFPFDPSDLF